MSTTANTLSSKGRRTAHEGIPDSWNAKPADSKVRELTGFRLARLEAEVLAPARRDATSAAPRLRCLISAYVQLVISDPGIMTLLASRPSKAPGKPSAASPGIESFLTILREDLTEAIQSQDRTPAIDPVVAVQSLLGIVHWGVNCHRAEGRLSDAEAAAQITSLALHGLS